MSRAFKIFISAFFVGSLVRNKISLEREGLLEIWTFFADILKSEYQEILPWSPIHNEIYGVLKVNALKKFA